MNTQDASGELETFCLETTLPAFENSVKRYLGWDYEDGAVLTYATDNFMHKTTFSEESVKELGIDETGFRRVSVHDIFIPKTK